MLNEKKWKLIYLFLKGLNQGSVLEDILKNRANKLIQLENKFYDFKKA